MGGRRRLGWVRRGEVRGMEVEGEVRGMEVGGWGWGGRWLDGGEVVVGCWVGGEGGVSMFGIIARML